MFTISAIFVLRTVVVIKPLMSGIFYSNVEFFFSKFCLSVLYWFVWTKVHASGILLSQLFTFVFSFLNFLFLATYLITASLHFFKSTSSVSNLPTSTFVFKLFKPVGPLTNLLVPSLSTSAYKAIKYPLASKLQVSTPVASLNYFFVA